MVQIQLDNKNLYTAWQKFVTEGRVDSDQVREVIMKSWYYCVNAGVDPYQKKVKELSEGQELQARLAENEELIKLSLPVMENLYQFVAGSGFTVTLADEEGVILNMIGDEDVTTSIARGNFVVGANWSETSAGTNSIGVALRFNKPIQIFSYEHFCICSHQSTCSAAPIHDTTGRIIGVLDMTGYYERVHSHTLGMVVAAVYGIEKQLESQEAWSRCRLEERYKHAVMESIADGILATDENGIITHINSSAARILQSEPEKILTKDILEFLGPFTFGRTRSEAVKNFTDHEVDIIIGDKKKKGIVSTRPIEGLSGGRRGTVVLINEIHRTRKLVQRMAGAEAKLTFADILGQSESFLATVRLAKTAASGYSNILLLGDSGTGKDVFAQAIHNASNCSNGPFVAINCGAIPRDLISSELFGYTEGAFTGAKRGGNPGKFELADGGTIFLDEIGEMPLELQTILLRVLEQKSVVRIGGQEVIPVNVRVIAATNRNLAKEVEVGNFRRDLFFRLNVISILLLSLREHREDVRVLGIHFIKKMNALLGKEVSHVAESVWGYLQGFDWPGNVRELYNVLERAMNVAQGHELTVDTLPAEIIKTCSRRVSQRSFDEMEKELISTLLEECQGNMSLVATKLGIARSTLYRKLQKYDLNHPVRQDKV